MVSENGCSRTRSELVQINSDPGKNYFISGDVACQPAVFVFRHDSDPTQHLTYNWKIDTATFHEQEVHYTFYKPGIYSWSLLVVNEFNCKDTLIKTNALTVSPSPTAICLVNSQYSTLLDPQIIFSDSTLFEHSRLFKFGDGSSSNEKTYSRLLQSPGTFHYELLVINSYGCRD